MEFLEDYDFTLHYHPSNVIVVVDALNRKSRGALASIASWEWRMLEIVRQFGLQYIEQTQSTLGSLVATPSLLSGEIESSGRTQRKRPSGTEYSQVQVTRAGPSTRMVVFGIEDG